MEAAKTLIRTCVRTFYETRQILIIDALLIHSVLDIDDLALLLSTQPKEARSYIAPLRQARLVSVQSQSGMGTSSNRITSRDYYYIHFHPAIDAIKYRIMRLKRTVEQMYKQDISKKDWRCPRCKAEYGELEVLDSVGEEGFLCHRCGSVLVMTEEAGKPLGTHEKIRRLNMQLNKFENIILQIDSQPVPENNFYEALARKKDIPRRAGTGQIEKKFVTVNRRDERGRGPDQVDSAALNVNLTSNAEQDKEEEARREARRAEIAKQNQLPEWHTKSAISGGAQVDMQTEEPRFEGLPKKEEGEEEEDRKIYVQNDLAIQAYLAEMKREQEEEERRKALEEMESADEDEDFEDVVSTGAMGTPASSQQRPSGFPHANGLKREFDSESGPSSDANTPANIDTPASVSEEGRETKRVKFNDERHHLTGEEANGGIKIDAESDEDNDEADFEDAM